MATDVVNTEAPLVDVATGEPVVDLDTVKVVRRTATVTYTMTYKDNTPDYILNATENRVVEAEVLRYNPFDAEFTDVTTTVLEGDERAAYMAKVEEENQKEKERQALIDRAEAGDETAMLTLLFGPEFAAAANLDFEDDEVPV